MTTPFIDLESREYERHEAADERRRHLTVLRGALRGEDANDALDREAAALTQDFADTTDAASLLLTHLKFDPSLRAFVDAVIGAAGGADDFVEITDKALAERMGRSTKSVQNYRTEFRAWPDHGAVIEIKDHWRDPETHESHAHAYRVHLDKLAVEAMQNARLSPEWARDRHKALEEAAHTVGDCAPSFPPRKAKKRRGRSDAELLRQKLRQGTRLLKEAADLRPMVRNPDYDELYELRRQLAEQLKAFDEAFGIEADFHTNTDIRRVETDAPLPSPEPAAEPPRVEAENEVERQVERQVETEQVENFSTWNGSTESTVYENQGFPPPEFPPRSDDPETLRVQPRLTAEYAGDVKKAIADKVASGKSPEEAYQEAEREVGEFEEWLGRRRSRT